MSDIKYQTKQVAPSSAPSFPKARSFRKFLQELDVTDVTGWRWRKKGWIKPINISGRLYVTEDDVQRFLSRAAAGEFAKEHIAPPPPKAAHREP